MTSALARSASGTVDCSPVPSALTITNKDKAAYTVKVTPTGGKEMDLAVKADSNAQVDCKMGCQLSLNGKTQNVDGKLVTITIKDDKFVM